MDYILRDTMLPGSVPDSWYCLPGPEFNLDEIRQILKVVATTILCFDIFHHLDP